jgi:hypothetical protein
VRHRARAHVGQAGGIDHRDRSSCPGIEQRQQAHFGWQAQRIVVDVITDDLHTGKRERRDIPAQHVEMAVDRRAVRVATGHEMHARLDHRAAFALRAQSGLDGADDLVVSQLQRGDVRRVQVDEAKRCSGCCHWTVVLRSGKLSDDSSATVARGAGGIGRSPAACPSEDKRCCNAQDCNGRAGATD